MMSTMHGRKMVAYSLLVFLTVWGLSLPALVVAAGSYAAGRGMCPYGTFVVVVLLSGFVAIVAPIATVLCLEMSGRNARILALALCSIMVIVAACELRSAVISGRFLKSYCYGFSQNAQRKVDAETLDAFFRTAIQVGSESEPYNIDGNSAINRISSNSRPSIAVFKSDVSSNASALLLWRCAGGGYGFFYGNAQLPKRTHYDESIAVTEKIWAVVRSE